MLKPVDVYPAGGVDSRSNPINMPNGRYLFVRDFWPQQDGSFRLRDGYTRLVAGLQANVPIYSIYPLVGPGPTYKPLIIFWQNKVPYVLDPATNAITSPTVKGAAISSGARWSYFYTNGHLHAFNGTDAKWFDGTFWRDIGLPTLTAAQVAAFLVLAGVPELTSVQAAAVTLTPAGGGSFTGDTVGRSVYVVIFDTQVTGGGFPSAANELGPATIPVGSGPVQIPAADQLNITGLPNLSGVKASYVKLIAITNDGGLSAFLCTNTSTPVTASAGPVAGLVTLTAAGHGLSPGDIVFVEGASADPQWSVFPVQGVVGNTFTIPVGRGVAAGFAPTVVKRIVSAANAATTATVSAPTTEAAYIANQQRGVAATSIGGTQPGYQFYASIYNQTTQHVGNRVAIGARIAPAVRSNVAIIMTVALSADAELGLLAGRTSDGAEIPYVPIDNNGNWASSFNSPRPYSNIATPIIFVSQGLIDGNSELPSRNYPPPGTLDYNYQLSLLPGGAAQNPPVTGTFSAAWVESDHCCGAYAGQSPTIYRSGSALDLREGVFVGLPEQSWDPADIETFPTGAPITSGQGYQGESWVYSIADCAALIELAGETSWQGPWNVGCAGEYAWVRGWQNMPFWITGDKQLATISGGGYLQMGGLTTSAASGPIIISDEYEAALLSQIGSQYLSQVEVLYIRKPLERVDVLRIHARDANGNPLTIIHDFNLRDQQSPYGQAYLEAYQDVLGQSPAPTFAVVRDQNWQLQVLAGAKDGNLYELYSGSADNGANFTAQALALLYIGPERTAVKYLEWYGDQNAQFFVTRNLSVIFDSSQMEALCASPPDPVQGDDTASHWIVTLTRPEMIHAYMLMQLTSHPADGSVGLNSPPHIPLESYGRIWMVSPLAGVSRGK